MIEDNDGLCLIEVSSQNNFCGYYVLARRIINDNNLAVILDQFNQFYQTDWYFDELVEVVNKMHPEQAEIMLGLVIHHDYPFFSAETRGLTTEELKSVCNAFGYNPSIFVAGCEGYTESIKTMLEAQSTTNKILISFDPPKGKATMGHYNVIEPDCNKFIMDASLRNPSCEEHSYSINNCGGKRFIDNIKKSVAEIKPKWTDKKKEQRVKNDEKLAWKLAIKDARAENLPFFKKPCIEVEEKTLLIELQRKEIEYYNSKRMV